MMTSYYYNKRFYEEESMISFARKKSSAIRIIAK
jgi:hypothetical protein